MLLIITIQRFVLISWSDFFLLNIQCTIMWQCPMLYRLVLSKFCSSRLNIQIMFILLWDKLCFIKNWSLYDKRQRILYTGNLNRQIFGILQQNVNFLLVQCFVCILIYGYSLFILFNKGWRHHKFSQIVNFLLLPFAPFLSVLQASMVCQNNAE